MPRLHRPDDLRPVSSSEGAGQEQTPSATKGGGRSTPYSVQPQRRPTQRDIPWNARPCFSACAGAPEARYRAARSSQAKRRVTKSKMGNLLDFRAGVRRRRAATRDTDGGKCNGALSWRMPPILRSRCVHLPRQPRAPALPRRGCRLRGSGRCHDSKRPPASWSVARGTPDARGCNGALST